MPLLRGDGYEVVVAEKEDADGIIQLFVERYSANKQLEEAKNQYAFPQFLDNTWLQNSIELCKMKWVVAKSSDNEILGCIGGHLATHSGCDCLKIMEVVGLVVHPKADARGIATNIWGALHTVLAQFPLVSLTTSLSPPPLSVLLESPLHVKEERQKVICKYILGEARSSTPAVTNIANKHNFYSLGYEIFSHLLEGDCWETTVVFASISDEVNKIRSIRGRTTALVNRLARVILAPLKMKMLPTYSENFENDPDFVHTTVSSWRVNLTQSPDPLPFSVADDLCITFEELSGKETPTLSPYKTHQGDYFAPQTTSLAVWHCRVGRYEPGSPAIAEHEIVYKCVCEGSVLGIARVRVDPVDLHMFITNLSAAHQYPEESHNSTQSSTTCL